MKLVKTLLITTVAVAALNASAKSHFEGTFVGAQFGTSKAASKKADAFNTVATGAAITATNAKKSSKFGVNGGVLVGHRMAVAQDVILGVSLGVDLESTKATAQQTATAPAAGTTFKSKVQRQYIVNLLGQAGYTVTKDILVFANAGLSFAKFKFSQTSNGNDLGGTSKNKLGWAIGAGAAYAINETVSADLSYLYTAYNLKASKYTTTAHTQTMTVSAPKAYHTVTVGVKVNI